MDAEQTILEKVKGGDHRAFGILVERHKDEAFTLAVRLLGSREEAEETVQDAFLRAYQALGSFRGESRFGTWLYRIVYNLCMTRVARRRPRTEPLDTLVDGMGDDTVRMESIDLLEKLDQESVMRCLRVSLGALPAPHRIAVELFYLQEQSYEEIATIMNVPLGTVKTYLFRGRTRLRALLVQESNGEVRAA
jgi:RNA polymerase sigma factor (sigma-70 family)